MAPTSKSNTASDRPTSFSSLEPALHPLLLRSLASLSFPVPTPIQATLIPLALSSSRDILARARTGSGKTLAYSIPILQGILARRERNQDGRPAGAPGGTRALILVPTRELAEQVRGQIGKLVEGLGIDDSASSSNANGGAIRVVNIVGGGGVGGANSRKKRKGTNAAGGERVER